MPTPKVVTQRYFQNHLKEITEPVEVTIQIKGTGLISTIGFFFPNTEPHSPLRVYETEDGYSIKKLK